MLTRTLMPFCLLLASSAAASADDYGVCGERIKTVLAERGAVAKVIQVKNDRTTFDVVYKYEFGEYATYYEFDDNDDDTAEAGQKKAFLSQMDEEEAASKAGAMWFLIVDLYFESSFGEPIVYKGKKDSPFKYTWWSPHVIYEKDGTCKEDRLSDFIYKDDVPEEMRNNLKTN